MSRKPAHERVPSACPHDCPSTCALEVERIDAHTIGRVYGAAGNDYTAGTLCAKVGRYAERVHHPDRLETPLRRVGDKGVGRAAYRRIGWDEALDEVAERLTLAAQRDGWQAVWPYHYAGTMGLVQRDGIERFRHVARTSRMQQTFCVTLVDNGWNAGTGAKRGVDAREMAESDLIVVWGGNPVATQVNLMHHISRARRERGAQVVVVDPYRTATAEKADLHLMPAPGSDAALACGVMHVLFRDGFADRDYLARYTDCPAELEAHLRKALGFGNVTVPARLGTERHLVRGLVVAALGEQWLNFDSGRRATGVAGHGLPITENGPPLLVEALGHETGLIVGAAGLRRLRCSHDVGGGQVPMVARGRGLDHGHTLVVHDHADDIDRDAHPSSTSRCDPRLISSDRVCLPVRENDHCLNMSGATSCEQLDRRMLDTKVDSRLLGSANARECGYRTLPG